MYKQTMIDKNYIPISIGALNKLLVKRKLPNPPPIPEYWNQKGRPEIMTLPTLIDLRKNENLVQFCCRYTFMVWKEIFYLL